MDNKIAYCHLHQLGHYLGVELESDAPCYHLRIDSRQIAKNDIFIAVSGSQLNGHDFIHCAVKAGAIAVIAETTQADEDRQLSTYTVEGHSVPLIKIYQLSAQLSAIADYFYHAPSSQMQVVGVTGTNGKTTTTQLLAQWLALMGKKSAVLGTIGNGCYGELQTALNTTSSAVDIQNWLADFAHQHVSFTAMEISSHGLALNRVKAIHLAAGVFTNLTRDHLDFHLTMENYAQAKWSMFTPDRMRAAVAYCGKAIINADDEIGAQWLAQLDDAVAVSSQPDALMTLSRYPFYVGVQRLDYHDRGVSIQFSSSWGAGSIESQLIGAFNVSNILLALATLLSLGYPLSVLCHTAAKLRPICGRMEIFSVPAKPSLIVDYAHTPDALYQALQAARQHCLGQLWVIFGCGGDRDRGKRPLMAKVAQQYADHIIVTDDNPRTEDEQQIVADIKQGFGHLAPIMIILDRQQAISEALRLAGPQDVILIAGKGHEDYQIVGNEKRHYSDRETAAKLLGVSL